jgi:hypothetical protein
MKVEYAEKMEEFRNLSANDSKVQAYREKLKKYEEIKKSVLKAYRKEDR